MIARRTDPPQRKRRDRSAAGRLGWRRHIHRELRHQAALATWQACSLDSLPLLRAMIREARAAGHGWIAFHGLRLRVRRGLVFSRVFDERGDLVVVIGGEIFR
jgi:hypothetical protein